MKQFGRILLRPVARLAGWQAARQRRAFLRDLQAPAACQQRILAELISAAADTDFGRDHGFSSIRTLDDFRSAVPIRKYEQLRPYMDRVVAGESTALLPASQKVLMFSMTSGTTAAPKHIPVTPRFLANIRRGWNIFGLNALLQQPRGWLRPLVQISSSMCESRTPRGVPCGAISGLLAKTQKAIVRRMYVAPRWAMAIEDPEAKHYTILRYSIAHDVAIITTANPSSTIKLIETGQRHKERLLRDVRDGTYRPPGDVPSQRLRGAHFRPHPRLAERLAEGIARDGELLPKHFWNPAFLTNWTGGTVGLYLRRLRSLFPGVPIYDIGLLASEGRFSLPLEADTPSGAAEITSNVLEFIPAEEHDAPNPQTLLAHELEEGGEYFLVVTNWAGLYRYNLDDRVRVTGFVGQTPKIEFLARGLHTANITGEKITEDQVVEAMRQTRRDLHAPVERFILQGRFAPTPYYELLLERSEGIEPSRLASRLDEALSSLNIEYASKRRSGRLGPVQPVLLNERTFEEAERQAILRRRGRGEQYKHQYLRTDVLEEEEPSARG